MRRVVAALVGVGLLVACADGRRPAVTGGAVDAGEATRPVAPDGDDTLTVLFTGDVLLDRGVRPLAERRGVPWLFEGVSGVFRRADAVVINLECPLADTLTPLAKQFVFHADTRWAADLRRVGVTHAALANNHTNDQGYRGLVSTRRALLDAGIVPLGLGRSEAEWLTPQLIQSRGSRRVAVFNAVLFRLENWVPRSSQSHLLPCQVDGQTMARAIAHHRAEHPADVIVVVLHWGVEFQSSPSMWQRRDAALLVHAGADVIIGHHPHVQQQMRMVEGRPVCYSLGNFVFDQHPPLTRRAWMARLTVCADTLWVDTLAVSIKGCRPMPDV